MLSLRPRVANLSQTFEAKYNTCEFQYNGARYYGEGKPLTGIVRALSSQRYMWTIFDGEHHQICTFATRDVMEPLSIRRLTRWMRQCT